MRNQNLNSICPACRSQHMTPWFVKNTKQKKYQICRCADCRSAFVLPRPTASEIDAFYKSEYYRKANTSNASERLESLLEAEVQYPNSTLDADRIISNVNVFAEGKQFLDVGGGYGFFSKAALSNRFDVTAIEPSPACREIFALLNGFMPEDSMLDKPFANKYKGKFNVILMSQVLEHIADLDETIHLISQLLTRNGIVVIAVPHFKSVVSMLQGENDMFIIPPEHLNFFTMVGLTSLFSQYGFSTLKCETISRFPRESIRKKIPISFIMPLLYFILQRVFNFTDKIGKGMYINCYFRKEE